MTRARALAPGGSALLAGAALPLAFAPFGAWPFAVLAPAALLALLARCAPGAAWRRGWLFGLGLFGSGASWVYVSIHDYGAAPVPLAAALTLLFCAGLGLFHGFLGWAWVRWLRDRPGGVLLGFPALWTAVDWVRGWILTGFPWLYPGHSQLEGPLAGWVPVAGVFGVGLILVFSAAVVVTLVRPLPRPLSRTRERGEHTPLPRAGEGGAQRRERAGVITGALVCAIPWLAAWPLARIEWTVPSGEARSVAMVQGNIPQLLKWDPHHLDNTLAVYRELSAPLWGADLVVWPESAVPAYLDRVTDFLSSQATLAAAAGSTLLLGIPTRDSDPDDPRGYRTFNSVIALGAESGMYHKRRLVPFGEYVPLENALRGLIDFFDLPMSSFSRGPATQPLLPADGLRISPFVCYEIAYQDMVNDLLPEAALLLTVSNDTWFGASVGPLQHLEIARLRALENGRDLVRATNNGVSVLTDHRGRVTARGAQFTREVIRGTVQPRRGLTPFARLGSWPALLLAALMLALPLARTQRTTP